MQGLQEICLSPCLIHYFNKVHCVARQQEESQGCGRGAAASIRIQPISFKSLFAGRRANLTGSKGWNLGWM